MSEEANARSGFYYAFTAYSLWGLMPLFWKLTSHIDPVEVTAHRAIWSLPVAAVILFAIGRTGDILPTLKSMRKMAILFLCSALISLNWGVFIWAIAIERTLDASLAYYINPLLTVFLGYVFLGDQFNRLQMVSITIAGIAVLMLTILGGQFPWISLVLAGSFATYGILRKTVDVGPTQGFLVEILLIFPFVLVFVIWLQSTGSGVFTGSGYNGLLLVCAGPATAIPLILYAFGAKRLRLSTIGLMQFMVPTIFFFMSIFLFGEPLRTEQLYAFIMIWIALALYAWSLISAERTRRSQLAMKRMG